MSDSKTTTSTGQTSAGQINADRGFVRIILFAAIIAAMGLLPKFDLPVAGGVPITAQSLGVMMAGVILGPWRGMLAVLLFLFAVALGAPLLAGGRGGLGVFAGPTVGFIIGFPFAAMVAGLVMQILRRANVFAAALAASLTGGVIVLYAFGVVGLSLMTKLDLVGAFWAVLIFIPGDIIKAALTAIIAKTLAEVRPDYIATTATR